MKSGASISPAFVSSVHYAPYNSSVATSASSSTSSLWSNASVSSDDTSISQTTSNYDFSDSSALKQSGAGVPLQLRQNPRRTTAHARSAPTLVRQSDRKVNFVDSLVDSSTQVVEAIWPLSSVVGRTELGGRVPLPLRTFIQETLRRSRTSYSTLQVALYYLILIKPHVPKHNFTTEQPFDRASDRALQCGRRMFLAALILASKYLQDRNYSARAWSRISGLNTNEINQNEIAFLMAVEWKLHITDAVFQRWTEVVLKHIPPPSPPSPGGMSSSFTQQTSEWKQLLLRLEPDLSNASELIPMPALHRKSSDLSVYSPRSILNMPSDDGSEQLPEMADASFMSRVTEPAGSFAPTMARLPTPRLTPQQAGFCTPAASAVPHLLSRNGSMGMAMAQANNVASAQYLDRLPMSITSSPLSYGCARRSSLANSVSTTSSPESMVSDTSRTSRSSSISSASSLPSATFLNPKLSFQSRLRAASKPMAERMVLRTNISSVPEDSDGFSDTSSPDSYTGPVGRLGEMCLDTPARRQCALADMVHDPDSDAARALQDLYSQGHAAKRGAKRSRPVSMEAPLQDSVREILQGQRSTAWPDTLVRSRGMVSESNLKVAVPSTFNGSSKRLCCSAEAANGYQVAAANPALNFRGPGMWEGILN